MRAEDFVGYLEHRTPEGLGSFFANTGKGGCTVFAAIVRERTGVDLQGLPWCVTFLFAVCPRGLGRPCAGVNQLARRMILRGRWRRPSGTPKAGDIIFLRNTRGEVIGHCGVVVRTGPGWVESIEGNAVDPSGIFTPREGGAVARRRRALNDWKIVGYADMKAR